MRIQVRGERHGDVLRDDDEHHVRLRGRYLQLGVLGESRREPRRVLVILGKPRNVVCERIAAGGREFIREARRWRKMLGGGMRQAGIIAAAGRYALAHNIPRLAEDHENATRLAAGLGRHAELKVAPAQTNMVFVVVPENIAVPFAAHLDAHGVWPYGTARQRWCTHLDVARADVDAAIACVDRFFA